MVKKKHCDILVISRTSEDPAEGNHQCPPSKYAQWARLFKYVRTFSAVLYMCINQRATYSFAQVTGVQNTRYTGSFPDVRP